MRVEVASPDRLELNAKGSKSTAVLSAPGARRPLHHRSAVFVTQDGTKLGTSGADPAGLAGLVVAGVLVRVDAGGTGSGKPSTCRGRFGDKSVAVAVFQCGHDRSSQDSKGSVCFHADDVYGSGFRRRHACESIVHRRVMSGPYAEGTTTGRLEETNVSTAEMTELTVDGSALLRGQEVRVQVGSEDLGTGIVDDLNGDANLVWIIFGGATPRRMFIVEDEAKYAVLSLASVR